MKIAARFLSYLFHPLLFPTYAALMLISLNPSRFGHFGDRLHFAWLIIVFALTFVFPAFWLFMMKRLDMIESFSPKTSKERIIPFIATATFYLWAAWMFKPNANMKIPPNELLFYMMLGCFLAVAFAFFINIFSNVSLHTIGAGGLVGLLLLVIKMSPFDLRIVLITVVLFAGLIGTARMILSLHTSREIFSGYLIGFACQFTAFFILPKFF